jgi:hypothetical protein
MTTIFARKISRGKQSPVESYSWHSRLTTSSIEDEFAGRTSATQMMLGEVAFVEPFIFHLEFSFSCSQMLHHKRVTDETSLEMSLSPYSTPLVVEE